MKRMGMDEFGDIVRRVMETLPAEIAERAANVAVEVGPAPSRRLLREQGLTDDEIDAGETLLGLFIPYNYAEECDFLDNPDRLLIFKRPHEDEFPDPERLRTEIRKTVVHELAHHFGLTDRDLERFDAKEDPWRK